MLGHKEGLVDLVNVVVGLRQVRTEGHQGLPLVFREQCRNLNCKVQARVLVKHVCSFDIMYSYRSCQDVAVEEVTVEGPAGR